MRPTRHTLPISPELLRRSVDLEVSIGAYARRQRRRRMLVGLLGTGLIALAWWIGWKLWPHSESAYGDYPVLVECRKCGQRSETRVEFRQAFPVVCPKCRARDAIQVYLCRQCGTLFPSVAKTAQARCPKCNSLDIGSPLATPPPAPASP